MCGRRRDVHVWPGGSQAEPALHTFIVRGNLGLKTCTQWPLWQRNTSAESPHSAEHGNASERQTDVRTRHDMNSGPVDILHLFPGHTLKRASTPQEKLRACVPSICSGGRHAVNETKWRYQNICSLIQPTSFMHSFFDTEVSRFP